MIPIQTDTSPIEATALRAWPKNAGPTGPWSSAQVLTSWVSGYYKDYHVTSIVSLQLNNPVPPSLPLPVVFVVSTPVSSGFMLLATMLVLHYTVLIASVMFLVPQLLQHLVHSKVLLLLPEEYPSCFSYSRSDVCAASGSSYEL